MAKEEKNNSIFHKQLLEQMVTLSTTAFGLAAALAWNQAIQQSVKDFIEPAIPGSGLLSLFIYALIVTFLGVLITYQLSRLASKLNLKIKEDQQQTEKSAEVSDQ